MVKRIGKVCENGACRRAFTVEASQADAKYCSRSCTMAMRKKSAPGTPRKRTGNPGARVSRSRKPKDMAFCDNPGCGKEYVRTSPTQHYCCRRCASVDPAKVAQRLNTRKEKVHE